MWWSENEKTRWTKKKRERERSERRRKKTGRVMGMTWAFKRRGRERAREDGVRRSIGSSGGVASPRLNAPVIRTDA